VPVVALSQLSRAVEQREDKRPMLSDLRDSGSIEQDADVVMFVYRDEYYLARAEPKQRPGEADDKFNDRHDQWRAAMEKAAGIAELYIAKQRHGPIGEVKLRFNHATTTFEDYIAGDHLPERFV
jgi:replicative DNA helicase